MTENTRPEHLARHLAIAPGYLLLLLSPVSVYLLLEFILKVFGDGSFVMGTPELVENARMAELLGRYKFLAAFAFFGAASLAVLLVFVLDLFTNYSRRTREYCFVAIVLSALVGLVLSVFEPEAFGAFETYYLLGRAFYESALSIGCAPECDGRGGLYVFRTLANPINSLTSFSVAAAMVGLILSLARRETTAGKVEDTMAAKAAELRHGQAVARRYLYCAGLLLTAGITFFLAWANWPSPMIGDAELRQAYNDVVGGLTLFIGVGYTLLILSCFLPVMLIHSVRADRFGMAMAEANLPEVEDDRYGVPSLQYVDVLKSSIAVLSPILATAIGTFGQGLFFP